MQLNLRCAIFVCLSSFLTSTHLNAQTIQDLMPRPKTSFAYKSTQRFQIGPSTILVVPDTLSPEVERAASRLESEVLRRCKKVLQRRSISLYLLTVPPFSSAIVLLPSNDKWYDSFKKSLLAHGENAPTFSGGYILDCRQTECLLSFSANDDGASNAVETFLQLLSNSTASVLLCHVWDQPDCPLRWIFSQHNLQVNSNVGLLTSMADSMATFKLNGIYQNDFKLGILDRVIPQYFRNVDTLKDVFDKRSIEVIPGVCNIGYSSNILLNHPQLAEGVEARTLYVIQNDTGRLVPNPMVTIPNGGFEQVDSKGAFSSFSYYDASFRQDTSVYHSGRASAKATNIPVGTNARFNRQVNCKPHEYYTMSVWMKTDNCTADEFRLLVLADTGVNQYMALTFTNLDIAPTSNWQKVEVYFNTLSNTKIIVYAGIWGARGGTFWLDDFELKPAGLTNVLRRSGTPLSVQKVSSATYFTESTDFMPIRDPWFDAFSDNIGPYHSPPTFRRMPGSTMRNGDTVEIRYFHPFAAVSDNQGNGSVMVCVSEDTLYSILDKQVRSVDALYKAKKYFMGHDEIRNMNRDDACLKRALSPAALLSDNIRRCDSIIHRVNTKAQTFIWSDMIDSLHNARNNYYLVNGDLSNVWNQLPTSLVVVNWNSGYKQKSMNFFAQKGFSQITSPYYDVGNTSSIRAWRLAQESVPSVLGMMYTTWNNDYRFLRAFSYYAWSAGTYIIHTPLDSNDIDSALITVNAQILADPFDATDDVQSAEFVVSKTSISQVTAIHPMQKVAENEWRLDVVRPKGDWFRYYISSTNKQGLVKQTPLYEVHRRGTDTVTSSTLFDDAASSSSKLEILHQPVLSLLQFKIISEDDCDWTVQLLNVEGAVATTASIHTAKQEAYTSALDVARLAPGYYTLLLRSSKTYLQHGCIILSH